MGAAGHTYHWNGTAFTKLTATENPELQADLNGVWVSPTGRVYAVGTTGTIVVYESGVP